MNKFEEAFVQCLQDGVHPGPTELNERMGRGRIRHLNGRECYRRRELMFDFGVSFKRNSPHGEKGEIPEPFYLTLEPARRAGWRRKFYVL